MNNTISSIILAAGQGKRMKTTIPKPLLPTVGKALIDFPIDEATKFCIGLNIDSRITVVTGHQHEIVNEYLKNKISNEVEINSVYQKEQRGTADAVRCYFDQKSDAENYEYTAILCADTPLVRSVHLQVLWSVLIKEKLDGVAATFVANDPTGYGRIIKSDNGFHIVEEKEATDEEKGISEVNSGIYIIKTEYLKKYLNNILASSKTNEFYLTDLFQDNKKVKAILFEDYVSFMGVNNPSQLEEATIELNFEKIDLLKDKGVRFQDSSTCYIDWDVEIESGCLIEVGVHLKGKTIIEKDVVIQAGSIIENSRIEEGTIIKHYSVLENAYVKKEATIGPFARLRPDAEIGEKCRIGNFVEIKKAKLEDGVKVSHLSYVGDASIGEGSNLGCGFITCNYDGSKKHLTNIGKNCFIGSDSQMIAPITIGDNCYVASGSTVNVDMKDGDFAIARSKQQIKPNLAKKFLPKK